MPAMLSLFFISFMQCALTTRESESTGHSALEKEGEDRTSCSERVDTVMNGPYGTWFGRKIHSLSLNDPFEFVFAAQDHGLTEEKFLTTVKSSMLFHCRFFRSKKTCAGVRNARFQEPLFPAKISPRDPNCFKTLDSYANDPAQKERCAIVKCYRELVEKNCADVVLGGGQLASLKSHCIK